MDSDFKTTARAVENHWIARRKPLEWKWPINARVFKDWQI